MSFHVPLQKMRLAITAMSEAAGTGKSLSSLMPFEWSPKQRTVSVPFLVLLNYTL